MINKPWQEWLEKVESDGVNLTSWEEEFIQSLRSQVDRGRDLSEKQIDILERIYSEKTP